jgi:hypothetical protein
VADQLVPAVGHLVEVEPITRRTLEQVVLEKVASGESEAAIVQSLEDHERVCHGGHVDLYELQTREDRSLQRVEPCGALRLGHAAEALVELRGQPHRVRHQRAVPRSDTRLLSLRKA